MAFRDFLSRLRGSTATAPRADAQGYTMTVTRLEDLTAEDLNGIRSTASGSTVTADNALRVAAVARSVYILAGAAGSMPLNLMEENDADERIKKKAKKHPLYLLMNKKPNRRQTSIEFRMMLQAHALLRGNGYALKIKGANGYAKELWPLHPDRVKPMEREDLSLVYVFTRKDGRQVVFDAEEIFHLRDLSTDGIVGLSRITLAREAIGLSMKSEEYGATSLRQGGALGGVLTTPKRLSEEAYNRLKQSMAEQYGGAENAGKWIITEEGLDAKPLSMTHADAQFLEQRRYQVAEIAGMFFGLPPHLTGDPNQTNWGTGIEQQNIGFLQFTLLPWVTSWEQALERDLFLPEDQGRYYFKFNVSAFLRASAKDRGDYYAKSLGSGGSQAWNTPNDVRGLEDQSPIEGGDVLPARLNGQASNGGASPAAGETS